MLLLLAWWTWADISTVIADDFASAASATQLSRAGSWGDSFGGFNALVSAFGFTAVLATLWMQAAALRQQQLDQHQQRFDSSFFELLSLVRELRRELRFSYSATYIASRAAKGQRISTKPRKGRFAVRAAMREFTFWLITSGVNRRPDENDMVNTYMRRIHSRSESSLGPYFRVIYSILDRIRCDDVLSEGEKIRYANLIRGQLTSYEIALMAINGLAPIANDLDKLIVQFRLLKYLPQNATRRRLERLYPQEAFRPRDDDLKTPEFDVRLAVQRAAKESTGSRE
jgi:hypothetical protein